MKEKSLSDKRIPLITGFAEHKEFRYSEEEVRETVFKIFERIRLSPNRDDKITPMEKPRLKLMFLDGGGIGKEEVKNIIKEEMGKKLIEGAE